MKILTGIVAAGLCLTACADPAPQEQAGPEQAKQDKAESAAAERIDKSQTSLSDVPEQVLALAREASPGVELTGAEYEVKNGREIYDVGGITADGQEIEFDIGREEGGEWQILETQQDITISALPAIVTAELERSNPDLDVTRIIEGQLPDGSTVYEIYGTGPDGAETQIEIMVENGEARTLDDLLPY